MHLCLLDGSPTFAMIAVRAGSDQVGPDMLATQVAGNDMVDCEIWNMLTAVLADVIIPAQDLAFGQLDLRVGPATIVGAASGFNEPGSPVWRFER